MRYIKDFVHEKLDTSKHQFLKEIILFITLYIFYLYSDSVILITFLKYIITFIIVRYLLSLLTEIKDEHNKKQFILNINVIVFTCVILLMNQYGILKEYQLLSYALIISYSLLVISTREYYTSDVIITLIVVHYLYKNLAYN